MGCKTSSHAKHPEDTSGRPESKPEAAAAQTAASSSQAEEDVAGTSPAGSPPAHLPSAPNVGEAQPLAEGERRPSVDKHGRRTKQSHTVPNNFMQGDFHNGFKAKPEISAFTISESSCAKWSLPQEVLTYQPPEATVISKFANGDQERKIHCNIRLSEFELERLKAMQAEGKLQDVKFYPSVSAMGTRFLSRARMDPKKAIKLMRDTQEWREEYFGKGAIREEEVKDDMQHGIVYFCGRDFALRPSIIIRPYRIPQKWYQEKSISRFIRVLIYCMEYFLRYMVVPGRIENLNVVVDLHNMGIAQLPIAGLKEVYQVLGTHYIGRVYKFYVCNVNMFLSTMSGIVKAILTDRQKQKLNILSDVKEMHKDFALIQIEKDLGGLRPNVTAGAETGGFFPFPMLPGPYDAGNKSPDADLSQVSDVHTALSAGGALGRLWDAKQTDEQNSKLEYGPKAVDVLKRCNLPVPPELLVERETSMTVGSRSAEAVQVEASEENKVDPLTLKEEHIIPVNAHLDGSDRVYDDGAHDPNIDEEAVTQQCFLCSRQ